MPQWHQRTMSYNDPEMALVFALAYLFESLGS